MNEAKSTRFRRLERRGWGCATCLVAIVLIVAWAMGRSVAARLETILAVSGVNDQWKTVAAAGLFACILATVAATVVAPVAFFLCRLRRRYRQSSESVGQWVAAYVWSSVAIVTGAVVCAASAYAAMVVAPRMWWLLCATGVALAACAAAMMTPLSLTSASGSTRPVSGALANRLVSLSQRADVPAASIEQFPARAVHTAAGAVLAGLGPTRRILLSDALIEDANAREVEIVVAHELGHHRHGDIRRGLATEGLQTCAILAVAHGVLWWSDGASMAGLTPSVASLPLLALVCGAGELVLRPWRSARRRREEHAADRFALELTGDVEAFESVMRRLADQHLIEWAPARFWEVFRSHPSPTERVAMARRWEKVRASA